MTITTEMTGITINHTQIDWSMLPWLIGVTQPKSICVTLPKPFCATLPQLFGVRMTQTNWVKLPRLIGPSCPDLLV